MQCLLRAIAFKDQEGTALIKLARYRDLHCLKIRLYNNIIVLDVLHLVHIIIQSGLGVLLENNENISVF